MEGNRPRQPLTPVFVPLLLTGVYLNAARLRPTQSANVLAGRPSTFSTSGLTSCAAADGAPRTSSVTSAPADRGLPTQNPRGQPSSSGDIP